MQFSGGGGASDRDGSRRHEEPPSPRGGGLPGDVMDAPPRRGPPRPSRGSPQALPVERSSRSDPFDQGGDALADADAHGHDGALAAMRLQRADGGQRQPRSEERRVGNEWVSTCRSLWSTYP